MRTDDADNPREYWEAAADGGRRRQLELAAADPVSRWLVADVPSLVAEPASP
jgi:hypothetical protein